jgi:hypothetical protein
MAELKLRHFNLKKFKMPINPTSHVLILGGSKVAKIMKIELKEQSSNIRFSTVFSSCDKYDYIFIFELLSLDSMSSFNELSKYLSPIFTSAMEGYVTTYDDFDVFDVIYQKTSIDNDCLIIDMNSGNLNSNNILDLLYWYQPNFYSIDYLKSLKIQIKELKAKKTELEAEVKYLKTLPPGLLETLGYKKI